MSSGIIYVSSLTSQADCTDEKVLLPMLFTRTTHSSVQSALLFNILNILVIRVSSLRLICLG